MAADHSSDGWVPGPDKINMTGPCLPGRKLLLQALTKKQNPESMWKLSHTHVNSTTMCHWWAWIQPLVHSLKHKWQSGEREREKPWGKEYELKQANVNKWQWPRILGKKENSQGNKFKDEQELPRFCTHLCFLPHWGPISQWWFWCHWHRPCHFAACLLLQCPFLSTPRIHANTINVHSHRCRLHSVKERKNGKSSPQQLCQNSFPRMRRKGERESIGENRGSVFQCA